MGQERDANKPKEEDGERHCRVGGREPERTEIGMFCLIFWKEREREMLGYPKDLTSQGLCLKIEMVIEIP